MERDGTLARLMGASPPFHHPMFVLTQHAREPLEGGTTFTFVTEGIEAALATAR